MDHSQEQSKKIPEGASQELGEDLGQSQTHELLSSENYNLDDNFNMALSYLLAFLRENDAEAELIGDLMGSENLATGLLQVNLQLLDLLGSRGHGIPQIELLESLRLMG